MRATAPLETSLISTPSPYVNIIQGLGLGLGLGLELKLKLTSWSTLNPAADILALPAQAMLQRIKAIYKFFDEWSQHSHEAWVKAGRPDNS